MIHWTGPRVHGALLAAWCCSGFAAADEYIVGVAKINVTPSYPLRLNGFGHRRDESEGVLHPIWAKAIAVGANDQRPAVLITLDNLGVRLPMVEEVARRLKAKAGLQRERLVVTFTHTHTAPKVNGASDTIFSTPMPPEHQAHIDRYTRDLTDALVKVALAALADRKPARLEWAVGKAAFAKNRRTPGGPVDHDLPTLVVRAPDGAIRAIYVSYACHCVTLSDNKIGGDWAGFAQLAIEAKHPGAVALVSIGCGSDSNPSSGVTADNTAAAAEQGAEIADEVERLLGRKVKPVTGELATTLEHIALPLNPPPSREELQQLAATEGPAAFNAEWQLARLDRGEKLLEAIDYPIQTWAFGDSLVMVFLAGEVCVDYSLRLKAELDPERCWIHGYANDFGCYIPSERLLKEGGYGGGAEIVYFALPNTLRPGLEEKIIVEVHRQVPSQFKRATPQSEHPLPPDEALASIEVKDDFVVELAAAEPLVADPVAIDFAADGRLWVADMTDYNRGVDDKFEQTGSVRALSDRDGDGRYDEATTLETGLRFPTDVMAWRRGVIVCDAPDVIYLEDADGDGRADVRKTLLTGFATHNAHARVNSLRWGLDNWVYGSSGVLGGKITSFSGAEVNLGGRDFRFRPDTGEIEPVAGSTQQGRDRDDWGNWFGCDNGTLLKHYPLSDSYLARNPHIAPPAMDVFVPHGGDVNRLYPLVDPTLYLLSGPPGRPTAVGGLGFYRDALLGSRLANNAFVAEPVNYLVHRRVLSPHGATFRGHRAKEEAEREFLAATDRWFRPVQIRTGLDGCLWVVDMHRAVIEHKRWIPEESLRGVDLMAGREQGRIYRVRRRDTAPRPIVRLDQLDAAGLAAAIDSPNGPQRDLAQQLLVQRKAMEAAPRLKELARSAKRAAVRLQALCALDGLEAIDDESLLRGLADEHPAVRREAIRLSEARFAESPQVVDAVLKLEQDADPQVQLQLAYSLGELATRPGDEALARLAWKHGDDPYLLAGVLSSVSKRNVGIVVRHVFEQAAAGEMPASLADAVTTLGLKLGDGDCLSAMAAALSQTSEGEFASWRLEAASQMLAHLSEQPAKGLHTDEIRRQLTPVLEAAREIVADGEEDEDKQLAALRVVAAGGGSDRDVLPLLVDRLGAQHSPEMQQIAIGALAASQAPGAAEALVAGWGGFTPATRAFAFDVLLTRADLLSLLLDKLAAGELRSADFDALQRQRLLEHPDAEMRERAAAALAGGIDADRDKIVRSYVEAIQWRSGDASRGRELFGKHCSSCHFLQGHGHAVGPDLAALTTRTLPALAEAILDPNRAVDERFQTYTALTADGLSHAGILAGETSTSVALVEQEGKQHVLLRTELEVLHNTGKSLMPEGFERDMTPPDVADVVAYLLASGAAPKKFDGNRPELVKPDVNGTLWLLATNCEIFGQDIVFEPLFKNIGYWYGQSDHVAWTVEIDEAGEYDAQLHWACADDSAGCAVAVDGCEPPLKFVVQSTGGYDQYRTQSIGRTSLAAGVNKIVMRPDGPLAKRNLLDLRGLYLIRAGGSDKAAQADARPTSGADAATEIEKLLEGLAVGTAAEYERIPAIWEHAIAAGKRNDAGELLRVIELSLPREDEPLADWQAVVLGGGVINGLSQTGVWPRQRLAELLADQPELEARWKRVFKLAAAMADDESVRTGTRYDALRILGVEPFERSGKQLVRYLAADTDPELQMGAVSGLSDVEASEAAAALIEALTGLEKDNRELAVKALVRTRERARALAEALARDAALRRALSPEQLTEVATAAK